MVCTMVDGGFIGVHYAVGGCYMDGLSGILWGLKCIYPSIPTLSTVIVHSLHCIHRRLFDLMISLHVIPCMLSLNDLYSE